MKTDENIKYGSLTYGLKLESRTTYCLITVSIHAELASGTCRHAIAEALMIKSFTDNLTLSFSRDLFNCSRNFIKSSISISDVR